MAGRKEAQSKEESSSTSKRDVSRSRRSPARKDTTPKSPVKSRSPARNKSPGRKSPSRGGSAKKAAVSPSRRSPSRKSPTRNVRGVEVVKSVQSTATKTKKQYISSLDSDSDTPDIPPEAKEKPKIAVRGRSRNADIDRDSLKGLNDFVREAKLESDSLKSSSSSSYSTFLRRTTRSSHSADVDRVMHLSKYDVQAKKLTEFSDDDEIALKNAEKEREDERKKLVEFGGTFGVSFLLFLLPISVYGIHVFCNETKCSFTQLPDFKRFSNPFTFFDLKASLIYYMYLIVLALLTALPFGGRRVVALPSKHEKFTYTTNAPFSLVVFVAIAFGLNFYGIHLANFLEFNYFHLILPSFVFGLVLAIYCYYRSFYVPLSALTTNSSLYQKKLYNFFMGRETNPRVFGVLDLKLFTFRAAIFGALFLCTSTFFQSIRFPANKQPLTTIYGFNLTIPTFNPTITTLYTLLSIYYLDPLFFEADWLTSFEIQYEGFGYMLAVGYALYPFFLSSLLRYVFYYGIQLNNLKLTISTITFLLGYILFHGSNSQKSAFRRNPYHSSVAHLETISTNLGKKLIVSGFWGIVRKPNYLGDILMHLALVPFVYNVPPVLFLIFTIGLLIHRTVRDNAHCKQKYGGSWERYCLKVKYVLLPKVY